MSFKVFMLFIIAAILQCLYDIFITDRISKKESKKANYDCSKCGNWRCYKKYCDTRKEGLKNGIK